MTGRISGETDLIQIYLAPLAMEGAFGLTDDAARITLPAGYDLVVSTDPIIAGVHFFADDRPEDIAWKALAVNVSDLIAKGAEPVSYTMALALPEAPLHSWMQGFSAGLAAAQQAFGCQLAGGDTDRTPGPFSIAITAFGYVPNGTFIQRNTARPGDHVFVTGTIGDAALGLLVRRNRAAFAETLQSAECEALLRCYLRPEPRIVAIALLRRFARAALDVSDGLLQDAQRLARGARCGLKIPMAAIPLSAATARLLASAPERFETVVTGGDDYEILFAVAPESVAAMTDFASRANLKVTPLGVLEGTEGAVITGPDSNPLHFSTTGYDHFRADA